jgi:Rieske Fe-S protein
MTEHRVPSSSRRAVLAGACAACAATLAGCARYGTSNGLAGSPAPAGPTSPAAGTSSAAGSGSSAGAASSTGTGASAALASTADIPVGGGKILTAQKIVITQPQAGAFHAFTAICTHQGCIVDAVSGGTIDCPCHGSKYSAVNGSVVNGPATLPLAAVSIKVQGTSIVQL